MVRRHGEPEGTGCGGCPPRAARPTGPGRPAAPSRCRRASPSPWSGRSAVRPGPAGSRRRCTLDLPGTPVPPSRPLRRPAGRRPWRRCDRGRRHVRPGWRWRSTPTATCSSWTRGDGPGTATRRSSSPSGRRRRPASVTGRTLSQVRRAAVVPTAGPGDLVIRDGSATSGRPLATRRACPGTWSSFDRHDEPGRPGPSGSCCRRTPRRATRSWRPTASPRSRRRRRGAVRAGLRPQAPPAAVDAFLVSVAQVPGVFRVDLTAALPS